MPSASVRSGRFPNADEKRAAGVLNWVLLGTLAAVVSGIAAAPVVYPEPGLPWLYYAIVLVAIVPSLFAVRRGHVRSTAAIFLGVAWLVTVSAAFLYGGPRSPAALALPVLVFMAGFLHSVRAAIVVAIATLAAVFVMVQAESAGHLPPPAEDMGPRRYWLALSVALVMTGGLVTLALRSIREALSETRNSERRYADMVEASPDGMVSVNAAGEIESINPAGEAIAGLPAAEMIGRSFFELGLLAPTEFQWARDMLPAVRAGDFEEPQEIRVRRRDGTMVPVEVRVRRVVRADGGISLQATMRDLSERRRAEEERAELEARLLQAQKLEGIGRLAGGVAHDFNNYLTVILGNVEMLTRRLQPGEAGSDLAAGIQAAAERSAELTRQLLAFSSKQVFQPQVIDLNELVARMEPMLGRILGEDVEMKTVLARTVGSVRADPAQIETALLNLVVNARDAMPDGGILTIETGSTSIDPGRAFVSPEVEPGPFVVLAVSDNGMGMDEEVQSRVFEPFFTTKERHGTGLGLSSVYGIVSQSGGGIALRSEIGKGSRFEIFLPQIDEAIDVAAQTVVEVLPDREEGTILLVEDEAMVRDMVMSALQARGYRVVCAAGGEAALELWDHDPKAIDLVVTDLVMPGMSGIELANELRTAHPRLPILFVSGYMDGGEARAYGTSDANPLLQKPFTATVLAQRVHSLLSPSQRPADT